MSLYWQDFTQLMSESYCSCIVINLDRCHRQMMRAYFSSISASSTSCIRIFIRIRICTHICIRIRICIRVCICICIRTCMISLNTQRMCIFIFGDLFLIPIVQSKLNICEIYIVRHLVDPNPSIKSKNVGFFYAVAPVITQLNLEYTHTFVHYGTCPLTCIHSSLISESDNQFQEQCLELSHYEPHYAIEQDVMSPKFHQLPFRLWGTSPCLIDSLFD